MNDGGAMARIDAVVDGAFEPLRGQPQADRAAAALSNLSDYGLIWVLVAVLKARRSGPGRRRTIVALGAAGFSSLLVSRLAKQAIERQRPEAHLDANVRTPSSSSFPSGHTLAAFTTAVVLPETEEGTALAVAFASAVAVSRVHLRAHHPTEVIGGAVIGSVLGLAIRPVVRVIAPGRAGRRARSRRRNGMDGVEVLLKRL
jgi:undecaprenyl-diphosphatase